MKSSIIKLIVATVAATACFSACNEDKFLEEVPLDFLTPENAYVTASDYETALTGLYNQTRKNDYLSDQAMFKFMGTDMAYNARKDATASRFGSLPNYYQSANSYIKNYWDWRYATIKNANVIITRVAESNLTDSEKTLITAEARFFRAFMYRELVYFFGGVPIVSEEVTGPKTDYVRDTKDSVLKFIADDFEYAAKNLKGVTEVNDGRVSNLVAYHYLAETCIAQGNYSDAIKYASIVIDDSNTGLMTGRFGSRSSMADGNVYFDLFSRKNQNRKSAGNKESLWVIQMEEDVVGGFTVTTAATYDFLLERYALPATYLCTDPEGKSAMLGGNGRSDFNCGGRGVSFMRSTDWLLYDAWGDDFDNDLRNASCNIVRTAVYDLPSSKYYGKSITDPATMSKNYKAQNWRWYPWFTKCSTPGDHPDGVIADPSTKTLTSAAGSTYCDQYMLRLAETYLLRAEAYVMNSDKKNAAADVNVIRNRANATPVTESLVSLDYILDERMRELPYEENRKLTLYRTGKFLERTRKYNEWQGSQVADYMALFPIPYSFIEANTGADIEQNSGYAN